jgi:hypothetical protein
MESTFLTIYLASSCFSGIPNIELKPHNVLNMVPVALDLGYYVDEKSAVEFPKVCISSAGK